MSCHRDARRRREQKIKNLLEKIMTENFPNLVKEIGPGSAENPKQDESNEAHIKTHHN